jgi:UDP-N-acetylglucosamine 2-epimerase (non-hydrolysing)
MSKKILFIIGTRPELIKVFPIINHLKNSGYRAFKVVSTGQHKELLEPYWEVFNITPDYELGIIKKGQNLSSLTARAIVAIEELLTKIKNEFEPDVIVSQGDTTTVMASSIVAFYNNIKFAHIEAGLRSGDLWNPFPEEFNRKVAGVTASYHFAPTKTARTNLVKENVNVKDIYVVGNTVVDTLYYFKNSGILDKHEFVRKELAGINDMVLITCHRRENHLFLDNLLDAIEELSSENENLTFVWPVHPNPAVKEKVEISKLANKSNVILTDPLEYLDLLKVISKSKIIISDSGGIQEEAPSFKVPVLILRDSTERPEAVDLGYSILVGMDKHKIKEAFYGFKINGLDHSINPYGDGNSSERIVGILNAG